MMPARRKLLGAPVRETNISLGTMIRALPERSMPLTCCSCRSRSWDSGRYGTNTIGKDRGGLLLRFAVSAAAAISLGVETALHSTAKRKAFFPHPSSIVASASRFRLGFADRLTFHRNQCEG